jgi:hypothetical protein
MTLTFHRNAMMALTAGVFGAAFNGSDEIISVAAARQSTQAAAAFLSALAPAQRAKTLFAFDDRERFNWHYIPRDRAGLPLKEMSAEQRQLAANVLAAGLSRAGCRKAATIMALETVLREIEPWNRSGRDPEKYYFSFFGSPAVRAAWGWRVEGHHLSLNMTVVEGRLLADAPRFLGANPAEVRTGPLAGTRVLREEEDRARDLVQSLDGRQRSRTVFSDRAFRDIVTGSSAAVSPLEPRGIRAADLAEGQRQRLYGLIGVYASAMPDAIARQRMVAIQKAGASRLHFGWAGRLAPGAPHYYRIQGADFLIEYDNVQDGANHIHTVWRDFDGDFGRDLLREHYRQAHGVD